MTALPRSRYVVFFALAVAGCVVDLVTKSWVFSRPELHGGVPDWLWTGHVGVQLSLNEGALWGMGQGKVWLFAALSATAAAAIPVWLFWFRAARDLWLTVALGLVMGGVLGNLYDRLGLPGLVRPPLSHLAGPGLRGARLDSRAVERPVALAELQYRRCAASGRRGTARMARVRNATADRRRSD